MTHRQRRRGAARDGRRRHDQPAADAGIAPDLPRSLCAASRRAHRCLPERRPDERDRYNPGATFTCAADEALVDTGHSLHVGALGPTYEKLALDSAIERQYGVISGVELRSRGIPDMLREIRDRMAGRPVYLCFDMDVFDPSVAPGVCTPSWGGLTAREGIDLLRCLTDLNIVAVDVNTVSPPQDLNGMAAHLCAHVIYETLVLLCRQMGLAGGR